MFLDYQDPIFGEKRTDEFANLFQTIVDSVRFASVAAAN